jgi:hypothetical protein
MRAQLRYAERFGQVVVGAGVERGDLFVLLRARGQDDHRNLRPAAQLADHVEAVGVGQPEVDDHEIGLARRRVDQPLLARLRVEYGDAVLERGAHEAADLFLVLDQDDGQARFSHGQARARRGTMRRARRCRRRCRHRVGPAPPAACRPAA